MIATKSTCVFPALLLFFSLSLCAQVPVITSFAPSGGPVGTTVTITGTNFDPVSGNNIVFFGATQATVSAATATTLTATVPFGASYQPISVLANGSLAYSSAPFEVTFEGGAGISASSFAAKVDFSAGLFPRSVAAGDLDGDGKIDLVTADRTSNTVSILRNTSTDMGIISYADRINYVTGSLPRSVAIGDLDGDGKPDLAVTNLGSHTVSVFRNTSTGAGTISYANKVDYPVGQQPYSVAISDLDGDGKADLAVANFSSLSVSVLRNTSTGVGTLSYADKVDFTVGENPQSVAAGDLDGDGKIDLALANLTDNTVSVLRNTSTGAGIINYASKVDYVTGSSPHAVAIGDLDGDDKLDLAVVNSISSTVSVFRNTGTSSGTISYAAKVDYTTGSRPRSVAIDDLDGDGKADLAVANENSRSVSLFRNTGTGTGTISYATKVDYATEGTTTFSVAIGDLDHDGRPDLAVLNSSSSNVTIFRHTRSGTDVSAFSMAEQNKSAVIDAVSHTVAIEVALISSVPSLVSTFILSSGATAAIGSTPQASGTTANDFTSPVVYTVTAEDGTTQDWTVTVTKAANTSTDITSFSLPGQTGNTTIDAVSHTIDVEVPLVIDKSSLISSFELSPGASAKVSTTTQVSGATTNDFTSPVVYTVTAEDGSTVQGWTVTVTGVANTATDIIAFSLAEQTVVAIPDDVSHSIFVTVPFGTDVSSLVATFTLSLGAEALVGTTAQVNGITTNDFTSPVNYTVTAEDGTTAQNWVVTVLTEAPVITSFAPSGGPVGTTVTITGTNFDPVSDNNIVFFGATQATVSAATATALTVTVPFGASYQPVSVLANGSQAYSSDPFEVTFDGGTGISASSFAAKVDFSTGLFPRSVAAGDLDGDGKIDLVTADRTSNTVSILRNTSTDTGVISYADRISYVTGSLPRSVAIGDLDGDGKPDLAVTNISSHTVSVFRNTSTGAGIISYADKVDYPVGQQPQSVAAGDLDGDGKVDLIVANQTDNTVSVLRNTSTGVGTISYADKIDFAVGKRPQSVAAGDLDGDGKVDLALANQTDNTVSVLRNTSIGAGNINYASKVDYVTGSLPHAVAIGDLDGDDKLDLAVVNNSNSTVSVFRNTGTGSGTISYAAKVDYTTGSGPRLVAIDDLDGDGKADLAVANEGSRSVSLFKNTSTGVGIISYASKVDYATESSTTFSVAIGDLDHDGRPDLAVLNSSSSNVTIFRHTRSGTDVSAFSMAEQNNPAVIDAVSHTIAIEVALISNVPSLVSTFTLSSGATATIGSTPQVSGTTANDFTTSVVYTVTAEDGSTVQDWTVTVTGVANTATDITSFSLPGQTGNTTIDAVSHTIDVEVPLAVDVTSLVSSFELSLGASAKVSTTTQVSGATTNDFTSPVIYTVTAEDGSTVQDWTVTVTGVANTAAEIIAFSLAEQTVVAIPDDVLHSVFVTVPVGTDLASLVATFTLSLGADVQVGAIVQINGATANDFTSPVNYTVTAEDGTTAQSWLVTVLTEAPVITSFTPSDGPVGTSVIITGTNFDPVSDNNVVFFGATQATVSAATATTLTVTVPFGASYQPVSVLTNGSLAYSPVPFEVTFDGGTGISASSFAPKVDFTTGLFPVSVAIGDLDGDGKIDLVTTDRSSNTVSILQNTSTGMGIISYADRISYVTGSLPSSVVMGDLDGDGKPDLAVTNISSHTVSVFRNTSTGAGIISYADKVDYPVGQQPLSVAISDLDGDGKADLVVVNGLSLSISVLRNTSTGVGTISYADKIDFTVGERPQSVAAGDLDGDGKVDLAVANQTDNTVSVLRNTSTGAGNINYAAKVDYPTGTVPLSVAIGDLDGDDKADLAVVNNFSNSVSVFRNISTGSGTISYAEKVDYAAAFRSQSVAIGDLNGDGKTDLAVANNLGRSVSLLRNTSTGAGTISYAGKVDYATEGNTFSVAIGDLDHDGRPDLAAINSSSNSLTIFRHANSDTDIEAFSFAEQNNLAVIDAVSHMIAIEVALISNVPSLVSTFTLSSGATAAIGSAPQVSGTTANDFTSPVIYTVTAEDGTTQDWTVTVTVLANTSAEIITYTIPEQTGTTAIDANNHTVSVEVPFGTSTSSLATSFSLSPGATAEVSATVQESGITTNDFTGPVVYTVTAEDGITVQDWTVTVTKLANTSTEIITYTIPEQTGTTTIDENSHTVSIEVPFGTNVSALVASFSLSSGATATIDSTPQVSGITTNDFTNSVIYTVTAEDGSTVQDWTVTVTELANTSAEIITYTIPEQTGTTAIDANNHTVSVEVPFGTNTSSLIASFSLSFGATAEVSATMQASGVTTNDFTSPVVYTVTAEDGSTVQDWTVTVTELANTSAEIITYTIPEQTGNTSIDVNNHTVSVEVPFETNVSALVASYSLSPGATAEISATVQESGITTNDFTNPVVYTVTAEDGSTVQDWTVSVGVTANQKPAVISAVFEIDENSSVGTNVGTVTASDPDDDNLTFAIVAGNSGSAFQIDQGTGTLTVADSNPLDFEMTRTFNLTIQADDGHATGSAEVVVNLRDVDEEPVLGLNGQESAPVVYPNPVSDRLTIQWQPFRQVVVHDLSGQQVLKSYSRNPDLSRLTRGAYILTLMNMEGQQEHVRIVKK